MAFGGEQYVHTLIPEDVEFVSRPQQVASFFDGLATLGAAPLRARLAVLKPSGEVRWGTNPFTGERISVPRRERITIDNTVEISQALMGLNHYDVRMSGEGPPNLPPFRLWQIARNGDSPAARTNSIVEFAPQLSYGLDVACCLRARLVSTSYWENENSPHKPTPFGEAYAGNGRTGFFPRPPGCDLITVSNAGSARFWIEFEFGKWIFPKIENSFNVLDPQIVRCAEDVFATKFVQACHWV